MTHPRLQIAELLTGDVLEVGPGSHPFPTAPGARVVFADRSVAGGRDGLYPELAGSPRGPSADHDVDLDGAGLIGIPDDTFDAVVASHVLEHLADPVGALLELDRVVRPGGLLVLVMPDRTATFDRDRAPTPLAHVLDEHRAGVREVSEDHVREFCTAIHRQPRLDIHTDEVWDWHDPDRLDDERLALHRARSIHVHCWRPEEFVVLLAGVQAATGRQWELETAFVSEDVDGPAIEFAVVLRTGRGDGGELVAAYARWLAGEGRDPERLAELDRALRRDGDRAGLVPSIDLPVELLVQLVRTERTRRQERDRAASAAMARTEDVLASRTYLTGVAVARPVRLARRLLRRPR